MIDKLMKILRNSDASSEEDSDYDGAFSHHAETHAAAHGIYDGMRSWQMRPGELPENADVQAEPAYYKGGYVVGTLLQATIVLVSAVVTHGLI